MAPRSLRLVDTASGEVSDPQETIVQLEQTVSDLERDLRIEKAKTKRLERDHLAEAEAHRLWPLALRLFRYHQRALNHPGAEWSWKRFEMVLPFLRSRTYGLEGCLRAIAGRRQDSWYKQHGKTIFEDIFGDSGKFERCLSECPKDWRPPAGALELLNEVRRPDVRKSS